MNNRKRVIVLLGLSMVLCVVCHASPIDALLERIDRGASKKFQTELVKGEKDFFELSQKGNKVVVKGNTYVNIAVGINWYLKYHAGVHLTWNQMHTQLPKHLPAMKQTERHETDLALRYDFNYCTFSYSMAFWDWERWQEEIDWMALHGINMPLAAVGHECVWRNMLTRLGYSREEINRFIPGPAFLAWWEMNNLEGWGGPNPDSWYEQQEKLQKRILRRMKELGMHPVLPGYSGMCPSFESLNADPKQRGKDEGKGNSADENKNGVGTSGESNQSSLQRWNGFMRPGVLMPSDQKFDQYAKLFYEETRKLYGTADFYSIDPFHEASNLPKDLNIGEAGKEILRAMKEYGNEYSKWVVQGWSENPRPEMLAALPEGDVLVLDLFSECRPQYGARNSVWYRPEGYGAHDWLFCLLENFGANVGLHGRMDQLIHNFYTAREQFGAHMKGWGLTMEGIETNPVMYELMSELPWRSQQIDKEEWVKQYVNARYGLNGNQVAAERLEKAEKLYQAWKILADGIYNCPDGNNQQGPHESIFCSRPSLNSFQASSWSKMTNYYDPNTTYQAACLMLSVADAWRGNNNFEYDLVDICRQALADRGRMVYHRLVADFNSFDKEAFRQHKDEFLGLLLKQDSLLATRSEFRVGRWIQQALQRGTTMEEKHLYEWNARVQITTWGNRYCADTGGLRDYAHKEWNGLLRDFYAPRWKHYLDILEDELNGKLPVLPTGNSSWKTPDNPALTVDWYAMEEPWTLQHNYYPSEAEGEPIDVAKRIFDF